MKKDKNLGNNIIILTLGGSHAYGMDKEGSDLDVRGIALNPKEDILLGLSEVDWDVIKENCYKNIIKLVCLDYKNKEYTTIELAKKYHIARTTVINYLHIGNENNWCNYYGGNKKIVYQYSLNGEFIRCWDSCNEAIRETGITTINYCLLDKIKQAGGYIWSYERK